MFWSANYTALRELKFLLKEENVSLAQVLEADDILQECQADNKALTQFLTKPEILAELITLITEEPPKNVELASQYRHASIACEVLTSQLSMLSDRLSLDTVQMNRLCDFINQEPPLNPLLASYFSKTVEMLLERSPKQDWYLYHIVCLRVLDFFRSRRDFLPNLLRHLATSAIADTFKYFIRLDDLFNKIVMEWLDEHNFLECLIQIICGTYEPEPISQPAPCSVPDEEQSKGAELNHKDGTDNTHRDVVNNSVETAPIVSENKPVTNEEEARVSCRRRAAAAAGAAGLLADLVLNGCAGDACTTRLRTVWVLVSRLQSESWVRALLGGMFTAPAHARPAAIVHGCQVLLALLSIDPILGRESGSRSSVELAVAPHLPLLHHALLQPPDRPDRAPSAHNHDTQEPGGDGPRRRVGAARVHVAALLAQLALSEVQEVPTTLRALGTASTLVELFFSHDNNNFLHAQLAALLRHALNNRPYRGLYANHLLIECDLLTRLMDAFEENENKKQGVARAGYMGHVVSMLRAAAGALDGGEGELRLGGALQQRWDAFRDHQLQPLLQRLDTPLGGFYPSENTYEIENVADPTAATYEFNDVVGGTLDDLGDDLNIDTGEMDGELGGSMDEQKYSNAKQSFLDLVEQRSNEEADMWEDEPIEGGGVVRAHDVMDVLAAVAPWELSCEEAPRESEGWAQWGSAPPDPFSEGGDPFAAADPFAPDDNPCAAFWPAECSKSATEDIEMTATTAAMQGLSLESNDDSELANNLLTAMSGMTPDLIANIVNANIVNDPPTPLADDPPVNTTHDLTKTPDPTPLTDKSTFKPDPTSVEPNPITTDPLSVTPDPLSVTPDPPTIKPEQPLIPSDPPSIKTEQIPFTSDPLSVTPDPPETKSEPPSNTTDPTTPLSEPPSVQETSNDPTNNTSTASESNTDTTTDTAADSTQEAPSES